MVFRKGKGSEFLLKIEKLNENQIRCILDRNDLESRELQLSELAYGSTKAKALFRDMMEQANSEFGFEVDNIPLMIEAIPVSIDCLILVVTKVEDPEELDTRFSRFSSLLNEEDDDDDDFEMLDMGDNFHSFEEALDELFSTSDDTEEEEENTITIGGNEDSGDTQESAMNVMDSFDKAMSKAKGELLKKKKEKKEKPLEEYVCAFSSLDDVIDVSSRLVSFYEGDSMLFKDQAQGYYYLVLLRNGSDEKLYLRACNICADHGERVEICYASLAYFKEHFACICEDRALETLHHLS